MSRSQDGSVWSTMWSVCVSNIIFQNSMFQVQLAPVAVVFIISGYITNFTWFFGGISCISRQKCVAFKSTSSFPTSQPTRLHRDRPALAHTLDRLSKPLVVPQVRWWQQHGCRNELGHGNRTWNQWRFHQPIWLYDLTMDLDFIFFWNPGLLVCILFFLAIALNNFESWIYHSVYPNFTIILLTMRCPKHRCLVSALPREAKKGWDWTAAPHVGQRWSWQPCQGDLCWAKHYGERNMSCRKQQ